MDTQPHALYIRKDSGALINKMSTIEKTATPQLNIAKNSPMRDISINMTTPTVYSIFLTRQYISFISTINCIFSRTESIIFSVLQMISSSFSHTDGTWSFDWRSFKMHIFPDKYSIGTQCLYSDFLASTYIIHHGIIIIV